MTTDLKYNTLRQRIEEEVFPRMTKEAVRAKMLGVLEDKLYSLPAEAFKKELAKEKHVQNLIIKKDEFEAYQGKWEGVLSEFRQILDSRPYNFKRFSNIAVDYARILQLQEYELEQKEKDK